MSTYDVVATPSAVVPGSAAGSVPQEARARRDKGTRAVFMGRGWNHIPRPLSRRSVLRGEGLDEAIPPALAREACLAVSVPQEGGGGVDDAARQVERDAAGIPG